MNNNEDMEKGSVIQFELVAREVARAAVQRCPDDWLSIEEENYTIDRLGEKFEEAMKEVFTEILYTKDASKLYEVAGCPELHNWKPDPKKEMWQQLTDCYMAVSPEVKPWSREIFDIAAKICLTIMQTKIPKNIQVKEEYKKGLQEVKLAIRKSRCEKYVYDYGIDENSPEREIALALHKSFASVQIYLLKIQQAVESNVAPQSVPLYLDLAVENLRDILSLVVILRRKNALNAIPAGL